MRGFEIGQHSISIFFYKALQEQESLLGCFLLCVFFVLARCSAQYLTLNRDGTRGLCVEGWWMKSVCQQSEPIVLTPIGCAAQVIV